MIGKMVKPDWEREGRKWPNRAASQFVRAGGMCWHVQILGSGPTLLLLHGAGAATHSWRDVAPILARDFRVIAPDLPGHGFTETPAGEGLSLNGMARGVAALLDVLGETPTVMVGHSAGAAIALRMQLDGRFSAARLISLNGAMQPFPGVSGHIFPAMAKLLFLNPLAIQLFALRADSARAITGLIESTGSRIDRAGLEDYRRLLRTTGHIAGALGMMANWNLHPLVADLPKLASPLTLVAAENDRAVPPRVAGMVKALAPASRLILLPGLGHLAHEEAPARVAEIVLCETLDG
ncbi:MAG TPA: alpha/beta fold hydrolase BchO [Caulobacteraceae bacterium]|nr:alpha/beta fold hydrolase BchO [Caulobacteraceae bacterium]